MTPCEATTEMLLRTTHMNPAKHSNGTSNMRWALYQRDVQRHIRSTATSLTSAIDYFSSHCVQENLQTVLRELPINRGLP